MYKIINHKNRQNRLNCVFALDINGILRYTHFDNSEAS